MELRRCIACGIEKPITHFGKHYSHGVTYESRRKICEKCKKNRLYYKFRLNFLKHFDSKCQCCGLDDIRFLTLDHVQNDGHKDDRLSPIQLYRKAWEDRFDKNKWNCLCWNCNCARAQFRGVCPHKLAESKEDYLERYKYMAGKIDEVKSDTKLQMIVKGLSPEDTARLLEQLKQVVK